MTQKIKAILATVLLTFAGMTLIAQIAQEFRSAEPIRFADGLNVVCTHATTRCPTCTTMERLAKETLDESFKDGVTAEQIIFREVNYEHPEATAFAGEFKVATASVVLVSVKNGEIVTGKNLVKEAWKLHTDEPAFKQMLKEQINAMLQGETLDSKSKPLEMMFDESNNDIELLF